MKTIWMLTFSALFCVGLVGCGGGAMPLTEAKLKVYQEKASQGQEAFRAKYPPGSDFASDECKKAEFEEVVQNPLKTMGYSFEATVLKALEAEKDNKDFLGPTKLDQDLYFVFVRQPLAKWEELLRWGAISQKTADRLAGLARGGR